MPSKTKKLFIWASEHARTVLNAFPLSICVKISAEFPCFGNTIYFRYISDSRNSGKVDLGGTRNNGIFRLTHCLTIKWRTLYYDLDISTECARQCRIKVVKGPGTFYLAFTIVNS